MQQRFVMVPGIGGSGPEHWQSLWQGLWPGTSRLAPRSWDQPELGDWIAALERAVVAAPRPPVLICHSLGCLLFAQWRAASVLPVAAAFLVAVPDPEGPSFPAAARAFGLLPGAGFGAQAVLAVASADDPYDPAGKAIGWAETQGARALRLGARGHLNGAAKLGEWPEGQAILAAFLQEIGA
ncbi:RBBP9/YdeN family alpha/beta hydrolase [Pararhodobacter sp.]|uniref:RBBP9/YdeN family alpha/beta hydrolase n=1 Tax=Pararhodobacter sp. TaxID=2127056 RepID=UPI002AFF5457|nr:alpha/beta hydrolase [Pararhodobacter sp.]